VGDHLYLPDWYVNCKAAGQTGHGGKSGGGARLVHEFLTTAHQIKKAGFCNSLQLVLPHVLTPIQHLKAQNRVLALLVPFRIFLGT